MSQTSQTSEQLASLARTRTSWKTLIDMFKRTATHEHKRGVYLHGRDGSKEFRTYAQLMEGALRVGAALEKQDFQEGDELLLCMPTSYEFIVSFFGALLIGVTPVPLAAPRQDARHSLAIITAIERLAKRLGLRAILYNNTLPLDQRPAQGPMQVFSRAFCLEDILGDVPIGAAAWSRQALPELAYIQLTSGTTGSVKGVRLTHQNVLETLEAVGQAMNIEPNDIGLCWLPLDNIMGLIGFLCFSIYWGLDLVLMDPERFLNKPHDWLWAIDQHRATITAAPDFAYYHCLRRVNARELDGLDLSSLRTSMSGAEPIRARHIKMFCKRFEQYGLNPNCFMPVYGLSEGTLALSFAPLNEPLRVDRLNRRALEFNGKIERLGQADAFTAYERMHLVSVGKPLPGFEVCILNEAGQPMAVDRLGQIATRGPHVMQGYANGQMDAERVGSWLLTGDLGYMSEDGHLFFVERKAHLITTMWGRRIFPNEAELFINSVDGIRAGSGLLFMVQDEVLETERFVVAYETQTGAILAEIQDEVRRLLKKHMDLNIETILELSTSSIPKTRDGKTRRLMAQHLFEQGHLDRTARTTELDGVMRLVNRARSDVVRLAHQIRQRTEKLLQRVPRKPK